MPGGPREESEARTRRTRIDPKCPLHRYTHHAVSEFPTANGPADYALFVDGRPLGIVEAKRVTLASLRAYRNLISVYGEFKGTDLKVSLRQTGESGKRPTGWRRPAKSRWPGAGRGGWFRNAQTHKQDRQ